ncbi:MAG TPA: class I SAM-dependent methyltransferase [Acidobacteriaceae bacterium]|nr:class I SAM-dependent methyltransferase [Acidobacteriaceae bacterium]
MDSEELKAVFDQQAAGYDEQQQKVAPILNGFYFVLESALAELPDDARILGIGVGTGAELALLARKFPGASFTVVEPSGAMLEMCRKRAEGDGFASRCHFHHGYIDTLPVERVHDAATCFLVSQFILEQNARSEFFRSIASRLKPGGILASSDLASGHGPDASGTQLDVWLNMMAATGVPPEGLERMRAAYAKDVAILPADTVASIIEDGGFAAPVQFFQAGLLHAWLSRRPAAELIR